MINIQLISYCTLISVKINFNDDKTTISLENNLPHSFYSYSAKETNSYCFVIIANFLLTLEYLMRLSKTKKTSRFFYSRTRTDVD